MSKPSALSSRAWILVLVGCVGFLYWANRVQIQRADYVTSIAQEGVIASATEPSGYRDGTRELIVPEHIDDAYEWITQTQQMLSRGEWRVRTIEYENAPFGREVHSASLYRWWLGSVAWVDHWMSGRALGLSVERAALLADPLLQLLFLLVTTVVVARQFGSLPASIVAIGTVTLYPLAAAFLPAVPDDYALSLVIVPWSILPLIIGVRRLFEVGASPENVAGRERTASIWFFGAGVAGGLGLWNSLTVQTPLLIGIFLGAVIASLVLRAGRAADVANVGMTLPWRAWANGGALTVLLAYLVEYFPGHLGGWELRAIHPLYGVAWWGSGEVLAVLCALIQRTKVKWTLRDIVQAVLGLIALSSLPVVMWKFSNVGFLAVNLLSFRLTKQIDAVLAPSSASWLSREGWSGIVWATLLPVLSLALLLWQLFRRKTILPQRAMLAIVLGPAVIALVLAYFRLHWWQVFDAVLLIAAVAVTTVILHSGASLKRWVWIGSLACVGALGAFQLTPLKGTAAKNVLSLPEVEGLVERDLAHWLVKHAPAGSRSILLAPPSLTTSLAFYGGMRGLASFSWENKDGLSVALRIVISTSREEALALLRRREVTHIVIPSWNPFFEEYTRSASMQNGELFYTGLRRWALPPWLRPIPYQLPKIAGFGEQSVMILEVVDEQDEPVALSRLAEYFLEMGQVDRAKATAQALRRFPADFSALVTRAQVEVVLGDADAFNTLMDTIVKRIAAKGDRNLLWDRRVSLAVALARAKQVELSRAQMQRCIADIDEARIRSLTSYSLFHFEYLRKGFGLTVADPRLRELIQDLSPAEQPAK